MEDAMAEVKLTKRPSAYLQGRRDAFEVAALMAHEMYEKPRTLMELRDDFRMYANAAIAEMNRRMDEELAEGRKGESVIDYSKEDKMLFNKFNVGEPDEANRALSFDEHLTPFGEKLRDESFRDGVRAMRAVVLEEMNTPGGTMVHVHNPDVQLDRQWEYCWRCRIERVLDSKIVNYHKLCSGTSATRGLSFDEMMNRIAPILDGTPNAHARAEKIIVALFGERGA
jgi:hypothetical protein